MLKWSIWEGEFEDVCMNEETTGGVKARGWNSASMCGSVGLCKEVSV